MRFLYDRARCCRRYPHLGFDRRTMWLPCPARGCFRSKERFPAPTRLSMLLRRFPRTAIFIEFRRLDNQSPQGLAGVALAAGSGRSFSPFVRAITDPMLPELASRTATFS